MVKKYSWSFVLVLSLTVFGYTVQNIIPLQSSRNARVILEQVDVATMAQHQTTSVELTEEQNGGFVALIVNDVLNVKVDGNPATSYVWEVEKLNANLMQQIGGVRIVPNIRLPGGESFFILTFKTVGSGLTHLRLIYHRPFEKNTAPLRIFDVTVDIQQ